MKRILIIGFTYPEPQTTGAGGRMMQLIDLFLEESYQITFATSAATSQHSVDLEKLGISIQSIQLNHQSFDVFISELHPDIVLFDRFITEEQFGWRVAEQCPDALRILDTEDLHFLRKARQEAVKNDRQSNEAYLFTDTAKRELASILRSDLSLLISEVEMELLQHTFSIPEGLLHYLPFLAEAVSEEDKKQLHDFNSRQHFMTMGNLLHAPNVDSVRYLKQGLWPAIKQQLPDAQIHIFGAYAPQQILELHKPKEGFYIKGWAPKIDEVFRSYRVCLAPLRFGAGLKGKLFDAMCNGTPVVTTHIGAEGMYGPLPVPGAIEEEVAAFAATAVRLYSEKETWTRAVENGFDILQQRFLKSSFTETFHIRIKLLQQHLNAHRKQQFIGQILQHQSLQSTKYMSKWIEGKKSRE